MEIQILAAKSAKKLAELEQLLKFSTWFRSKAITPVEDLKQELKAVEARMNRKLDDLREQIALLGGKIKGPCSFCSRKDTIIYPVTSFDEIMDMQVPTRKWLCGVCLCDVENTRKRVEKQQKRKGG